MNKSSIYLFFYFFTLLSCTSDTDSNEIVHLPSYVNLDIPLVFQDRILPPVIPANNPLTAEGIALGKKLFFDKNLSANGTQSCAGCHSPSNSFTDGRQYSVGIDNIEGNRNSMPLFNLAWNYEDRFFGTAANLVSKDKYLIQ